jgi:hypothetical protein
MDFNPQFLPQKDHDSLAAMEEEVRLVAAYKEDEEVE